MNNKHLGILGLMLDSLPDMVSLSLEKYDSDIYKWRAIYSDSSGIDYEAYEFCWGNTPEEALFRLIKHTAVNRKVDISIKF